jgi:hypothetical protein
MDEWVHIWLVQGVDIMTKLTNWIKVHQVTTFFIAVYQPPEMEFSGAFSDQEGR